MTLISFTRFAPRLQPRVQQLGRLSSVLDTAYSTILFLDYPFCFISSCTQQHSAAQFKAKVLPDNAQAEDISPERFTAVIVYNRLGSVFIELHIVQIKAANPSWSRELGINSRTIASNLLEGLPSSSCGNKFHCNAISISAHGAGVVQMLAVSSYFIPSGPWRPLWSQAAPIWLTCLWEKTSY